MSSFAPHLFRRTSHVAGRATDKYSIFDRFGEYELSCNGNVEKWSVIDRLHRISCPILVINGVEDSARDECVEPFVSNIPKVMRHLFRTVVSKAGTPPGRGLER